MRTPDALFYSDVPGIHVTPSHLVLFMDIRILLYICGTGDDCIVAFAGNAVPIFVTTLCMGVLE